jgi:hypothetical protein
MENEDKIYIDFSAELKERLAEQGINAQEILEAAGIACEMRYAALPPEHPGKRTRELVPVIMAGSVAAVSLASAVALITSAISKFLDRKAGRLRYVEYLEERPVLDVAGNPVLDERGQVQTIRVPVHKFIEPENLTPESFSVEIGLKQGVVVKWESGKGAA